MTERAALPRVFDLTWFGYYLDFVLAPLTATVLVGIDIYRHGARLALVGLLVLGALAWTLAEYLIHRFAFHGPLRKLHDIHHDHPADYVGVPSWAVLGVLFMVWTTVALVGPSGANPAVAGILFGYLLYIVIHDRYHHGNRRRFGRYVKFMDRHHAGHHRGGEVNFGVSSPLWDFAFGTFRSTPR